MVNILSPLNCGGFLLRQMTMIRLNLHLVDHFPPKCGACVMSIDYMFAEAVCQFYGNYDRSWQSGRRATRVWV